VKRLETPKAFAPTHVLYEHAVALYVETVGVYAVAVALPAGDERTQLDLLARRLRELGDRIFDSGRRELGLADEATPDIEINVPEEVPDWAAEGLASGPPFDDPQPPPSESPSLRAETRPEQPRSKWQTDVRAARIPSPAQLNVALAAAEPSALRDLARRYVAAAEFLRQRPDPNGGREESARFRLALLVAADAARARQASRALSETANRLAAIAAAMMSDL
jgi:hypothetical protein